MNPASIMNIVSMTNQSSMNTIVHHQKDWWWWIGYLIGGIDGEKWGGNRGEEDTFFIESSLKVQKFYANYFKALLIKFI